MDISAFSTKYMVRKLNTGDTDIIFDLAKDNKTYYKYHSQFVSIDGIIEGMNALPPIRRMMINFMLDFLRRTLL